MLRKLLTFVYIQKEMKLSVVIPVYRVEAFLRKCVDSVVSQEIDDMEIILVDDCSPDGSGRLCDTLACSDARIRVVHRGQTAVSALPATADLMWLQATA